MATTTANRRYIFQEMLGQGGMGTVFRAQDRLTSQDVALKRISLPGEKLHGTPGSEFHVALSNEFRVLASLRHPNIIKVLDYGIDAGQPYFTMELLAESRNILTVAHAAELSTRIR